MTEKTTNEEKTFLWNFRLHAENILTNRTNFFLVAQSFFAVAAATLINNAQNPLARTALTFISLGGLIISFIWFLLGFKLHSRLGRLERYVRNSFSRYKEIMDDTESCISSNCFIAFLIPGLFVLGWLLFTVLIFYIPSK